MANGKGQSDKQTITGRKRKVPRTAWKPGQSGNPKGRPPLGGSIAEQLRTILAEDAGDGRTKREAILRRVVNNATQGKPWAVEFVADRREGKLLQPLSAPTKIVLQWEDTALGGEKK